MEDFFAYTYAVLHSPSYRERYKEFLKIDFPRIPLPKDEAEYQRLVNLGQQLIDLHLMKADLPMAALSKYPVAGDNRVEAPRYEDGKVYINETQYYPTKRPDTTMYPAFRQKVRLKGFIEPPLSAYPFCRCR